jgi:hypothetical protein
VRFATAIGSDQHEALPRVPEEDTMNDQAILSIVAAIALVFEVQAVQNLVPVIWIPDEMNVMQTISLCTDVDLNTGCAISLASAGSRSK